MEDGAGGLENLKKAKTLRRTKAMMSGNKNYIAAKF